MDHETLLRLCKIYASMGDALTEQLHSALDLNLNKNNYNPNAEPYLLDFLYELEEIVNYDPPVRRAIEHIQEYTTE